jgi:hypothetical protein
MGPAGLNPALQVPALRLEIPGLRRAGLQPAKGGVKPALSGRIHVRLRESPGEAEVKHCALASLSAQDVAIRSRIKQTLDQSRSTVGHGSLIPRPCGCQRSRHSRRRRIDEPPGIAAAIAVLLVVGARVSSRRLK